MFLDWFELLCFCLSFFLWFISSCFGMIWQWLEWSFVLHLSKFCILRSVDQRGDLMGFTLASLARGKWPSSVKSSSSRFNSSIRLTARFWCVSTRKCWIWWWEHFNSIPMGWLGFSSVKVSVLVVFLFGSWCAEDIFCPVQWAFDSWCWPTIARCWDESSPMKRYDFFEHGGSSICLWSLQVEQKICPLCFLKVANDLSMYWPQPRQRKIGLINETSHFFWAVVVITAAKIGLHRRSNRRWLGLDLSEALTNQKTRIAHTCWTWVLPTTAITRAILQQQRAWSV